MTIGEIRNIDWLVNQELRLAAQLLHRNRPVHRPHYCRSCTDPSVNLLLHRSFTREQDPNILKLLHLRQELSTNLKWASHLYPTEHHGLGLGGADSNPSRFTLSCKPSQCMPKFLVWRCQQDNIICKKQRWNRVVPKPDTLRPLTAHKNSVHKNYEQNRWQRAAMPEPNMHREQVWLTAGNANQAPAPVVQGLDSP